MIFQERATDFETDFEEREEGHDQSIIDSLENEIYDLSGVDERTVREILDSATKNFDDKPNEWMNILRSIEGIIKANRDGEYEDDEEKLTADLEEQRVAAKDLTLN